MSKHCLSWYTVSCKISANTSGDINGISGNYSLSEGLVYKEFATSSSVLFNIVQTTNKGFVLGNTSGLPAKFTLGTLKVTIPGNATSNTVYSVTIKNIGASDLDYDSVSISNVTDSIKVISKEVNNSTKPGNNTQKKSSNANLSEINLNGNKIEIIPTKTEYSINVKYETEILETTYKVEDKKASAKVSGDSRSWN
ncbi:MAG: hypothetical protein E7165_03605 [Firmicutes bacterium]|nr:hypothetical protein [Bacillota bacterium]